MDCSTVLPSSRMAKTAGTRQLSAWGLRGKCHGCQAASEGMSGLAWHTWARICLQSTWGTPKVVHYPPPLVSCGYGSKDVKTQKIAMFHHFLVLYLSWFIHIYPTNSGSIPHFWSIPISYSMGIQDPKMEVLYHIVGTSNLGSWNGQWHIVRCGHLQDVSKILPLLKAWGISSTEVIIEADKRIFDCGIHICMNILVYIVFNIQYGIYKI